MDLISFYMSVPMDNFSISITIRMWSFKYIAVNIYLKPYAI